MGVACASGIERMSQLVALVGLLSVVIRVGARRPDLPNRRARSPSETRDRWLWARSQPPAEHRLRYCGGNREALEHAKQFVAVLLDDIAQPAHIGVAVICTIFEYLRRGVAGDNGVG